MPYAETKVVNQLKHALHHCVNSVVVYDNSLSVLDENAVRDVLECASAAARPVRFIRWCVVYLFAVCFVWLTG